MEQQNILLDFGQQDDVEIIDISKKINFNEMINLLKENETLVFYSKKKLYFLKEDILKVADFEKGTSLTPFCKNAVIDINLINQTFYYTNKTVNQSLSAIGHHEVREYLYKNYTLFYVNSLCERVWILWLDEEGFINCSSDNIDCDEAEYDSMLATDLLDSYINGDWYIADNSNV